MAGVQAQLSRSKRTALRSGRRWLPREAAADPRAELREVIAATYHQVWWPSTMDVEHDGGSLPVWDEHTSTYLDPATGEVLPTWDQALDAIGDGDQPQHVARFGQKFDAQGVLAGSRDASRYIGYLTKYLTKHLGECHQVSSDAQAAHATRLADALRYEPCSPTCANWLRYGIQPKNARPGLIPGCCKGKAHRREYLGYAGRRVLVSRKWSGKVWPTTAPTGGPGSRACSGFRQLTWPGTPGSRSNRATRTTCLPASGCCMSSPTASNGKPHSNRRGGELLRPSFRQTGRPHDGPTRSDRDSPADRGSAARRLSTSPRFIRRLIAERRIEFVKVGRHVRISESALADFIDAGRVQPLTTAHTRHKMRGVA